MILKMIALEEEGNRDTDKELMENRMREAYQLKKSEAIIKFEMVMSKMLNKSIKKTTIKTLIDCKQPLFNKNIAGILDQLTSYYQAEVNIPDNSKSDGSAKTGTGRG